MCACANAGIGRLNRAGMDACRAGNLDEAEVNLVFALMKARAAGVRCFEAKIQNNLGIVCELGGRTGKARHYYAEAYRILESKVRRGHPVLARVGRSLERVGGMPAGVASGGGLPGGAAPV